MAQEASHLSDSLGPFDCPCHSCSQQGGGVWSDGSGASLLAMEGGQDSGGGIAINT